MVTKYKCLFVDACHTFWNNDGGQIRTISEGTCRDVCYATSYGGGGQVTAGREGMMTDACHTVGYGDRLQIATSEGTYANAFI